jgi:hypothetical protein
MMVASRCSGARRPSRGTTTASQVNTIIQTKTATTIKNCITMRDPASVKESFANTIISSETTAAINASRIAISISYINCKQQLHLVKS